MRSKNLFMAVSQSSHVRVTSENLGQFPVLQVLEGTDDWVLWIFVIPSFSTLSRSKNPFFSFSKPACLEDFGNPGQLTVSPVLEGTDDWVLQIFVIVPQLHVDRKLTWIFKVTWTWLLFGTARIGTLDLENVKNEEIITIPKTQSSVPSRPCKTGSWPGFSRSLEHSSFVKLREMDSSTKKT